MKIFLGAASIGDLNADSIFMYEGVHVLNSHASGGGVKEQEVRTKSAPVDTRSALTSMLLLYVLVIAAQFVSLAFGRVDEGRSLASIALPSLLFLSVLTLPACWVGIVLGRRVGLGVWRHDAAWSVQSGKVWTAVVLAGVLGLLFGGILLGLRILCQPYLPPELPALGFRGVAGGLAVSVGAAVGEEVWFRFGLMTALVWIAGRMINRGAPSRTVIWTVIVLASVGFGLAHLPQLASYGAAAPIAVVATIAGNVIVGVLYGWCYWRMGLAAAITAHFTVDLVLHVLTAALA